MSSLSVDIQPYRPIGLLTKSSGPQPKLIFLKRVKNFESIFEEGYHLVKKICKINAILDYR